ncbi:MAG: TlpA family protein disulfide reductase [Chloroflexota bacterium]
MTARRSRPVQGKTANRLPARSRRRDSRNQGLLILVLAMGTVVVLGIILYFALQRSSTVATTDPTPVPAPTTAEAAGVPTLAIAPVPKVNHPVAGIGILNPASGSAKAAPATPKVGQPAPNFAWQTAKGHADLKGLRGHVVLLDFFAPWCDACQGEETWLAELLQAYGPSGLKILGVSSSPYGIHYEDQGSEAPISMGDLVSYRKTFHVTYPLVFDRDSRVFNLYGRGASYPSYYLIDAKGIVRFGTTTTVTEATLNQQIQAALAE